MKLFSKRHSERRLGAERIRYRRDVTANELLVPEARNRLISEIRFLSSRNDFLEWNILFEDKRSDPSTIYYDEEKLDDFSMAELGYRLSDNFSFDHFNMVQSKQTLRYASEKEEERLFFDDYHLFDLAEITILFSKKKERHNVIKRINGILAEEETGYEIIEHLITRKSGDDLRAVLGILKDLDLKLKLERYFDYYSRKDYINAAKVSAEVLNIIFSDVKESNKKKQIEEMKGKLSRFVISDKSEAKREKIASYINDALILSRNLNNDIYDIRHTEKSTLKPSGDNVYKMVARQNISIIELTITSLKDDFVLSDDWENIKAEYNEKYKINIKSRNVFQKPVYDDTPIDLSEIPF